MHSSQARTAFVGMAVTLVPILMLFLAFASAYIVRQGMGEAWTSVSFPALLWANTALLLLSGLPLEKARRSTVAAAPWVWLTGALGVLFLAGQWLVWRRMLTQGIDPGTSPHSSFFYVLTAAHGVHVFAGMVGLLVAATWPMQGRCGLDQHQGITLAAMYWHFMAALWLGIVLLLVFGG